MSEVINGKVTDSFGTIRWYKDGELHRDDGPAVDRYDGVKIWYINGKPHREDGPAVEYSDGRKDWFLNGVRHREGGPAIEFATGSKEWYHCGELHREDGPAREYLSGTKLWYLNDIEYTEEEFNQWLAKKHLNEKLQSSLAPSPTIKRGKI